MVFFCVCKVGNALAKIPSNYRVKDFCENKKIICAKENINLIMSYMNALQVYRAQHDGKSYSYI